ncbi:MAG: sugar ABC transporter ATP-binding protein [Clostridiales Family XIII bacterium]|uniref:Sugar ABC transporter ATP-binding protein n=1 Tax=Hominibacterium faecale TaxID=2839743 RepID=A0A9J6QLT5_9FIRM|nr:sugar ABC transporter ATP-binding protein [Hominibacterium faecale]MCI7302306.1 sugar ABC transporter ATP-binding protein [Clostridia bacterium]MCU7378129.1 sugar ABC transporter ATP-binding protein [Hominibacterium faecale]MDY3011440.1 sugar ABC transporter ATP-binding protein [Clostridiales Family XIII bacterium]
MSFKDMLAEDRTKVFVDPDIFGETHLVNGKEIVIVIDNDELKERQGSQDLAVEESTTLFYCKKEDLPVVYPGQTIKYDRRICMVDDVKDDMGMLTVALHENIGR